MSKSKINRQKAREIFCSFYKPIIPEEGLDVAGLLEVLPYPITDMQDFRDKINATKDDPRNYRASALKQFSLSLFSPKDLPILTMRNAIEKLYINLELRAGQKNGNCNCNDSRANEKRDNPFDDWYAIRQNEAAEDCRLQYPGDVAWSHFCSCIHAGPPPGMSKNAQYIECLNQLLKEKINTR